MNEKEAGIGPYLKKYKRKSFNLWTTLMETAID